MIRACWIHRKTNVEVLTSKREKYMKVVKERNIQFLDHMIRYNGCILSISGRGRCAVDGGS